MSNQTWYLTNPSNLANLAQKLADPTPLTISDGSPSLKPDSNGSDDRFEHKKMIFNRPDCMYTGKVVVLHRWVCFADFLVRSVEIHRDLIEISTRFDLISSRSTEISLRFSEISSRFGLISSRYAEISLRSG